MFYSSVVQSRAISLLVAWRPGIQLQTGRLLRMKGWPVRRQDNQSHDGRHPGLSAENGKSTKPDWGWGATVELKKNAKAGDSDLYEVAVLVMCKPEDMVHGRGQQNVAPTPMVSCAQVERPQRA